MGYAFDADYVRRLSGGDALVVQHFHARFEEILTIKLRRKLRTRQEIDDVRQETFARVFASLDKLRDPGKLGGFVQAVCDNVLHEHFRSRQRNRLSDHPAPDAPDPRERADSRMARREIVNLVRVVLDELPDTDGTLLREVFLEERDRDEVCERHEVSRDYLRVLLHRAKQRFRELYEESIARQARSLRGRLATDGPRPRAAD